jgi:hypothetical protein
MISKLNFFRIFKNNLNFKNKFLKPTLLTIFICIIILRYFSSNLNLDTFFINTNLWGFDFKPTLSYLLVLILFVLIYTLTPIFLLTLVLVITTLNLTLNYLNTTYLPIILKTHLAKFLGENFNDSFINNIFSENFLLNLNFTLNSFHKGLYSISSNESLINYDNFIEYYLDYPIFIYFGLFFFLTTFMSLLTISYLGLYGTFILNLTSLTLLWISIIPYAVEIFSNNTYYYVSFGK